MIYSSKIHSSEHTTANPLRHDKTGNKPKLYTAQYNLDRNTNMQPYSATAKTWQDKGTDPNIIQHKHPSTAHTIRGYNSPIE